MTLDNETLEELLRDPIIELVMASDRVRPDDVRILLERVRRHAGKGLSRPVQAPERPSQLHQVSL